MGEAKTAAKTAAKEDGASMEKTYSLEALRKNSVKLFGVTTSTFDGAMSGQAAPLTINAAKGIIEKWKKGVAR